MTEEAILNVACVRVKVEKNASPVLVWDIDRVLYAMVPAEAMQTPVTLVMLRDVRNAFSVAEADMMSVMFVEDLAKKNAMNVVAMAKFRIRIILLWARSCG